jgi:serpin B
MDKVLHGAPGTEPDVVALLRALGQVRLITERKEDGSRVEVPSYQLSTANGVFTQQGWHFVEGFRGRLVNAFQAELAMVDFGDPDVARAAINGWVERKTKDKIKDLVPKGLPRPNTRMVLANAIHFKANWQDPFSVSATVDGPFTTPGGSVVTVKRMRRGGRLRYAETETAQVVELPYQGRDTAMVVLVPGRRQAGAVLNRPLGRDHPRRSAISRAAASTSRPKFSFTSAYELSDAQGPSCPGLRPGPGRLLRHHDAGEAWIAAVLHKAFVAVDEEGTEAAAATAVLMEGKSMPRPEEPVKVIVDRPFVVVIRHVETGEILFLGRITDPTKK